VRGRKADKPKCLRGAETAPEIKPNPTKELQPDTENELNQKDDVFPPGRTSEL
jgi:hypothetical protein